MSEAPLVQSSAQSNIDLVHRFGHWMRVKNYSPSTVNSSVRVLRTFCKFLGADDIKAADRGRLRAYLAERGRSPSVREAHRQALRQFYRLLVLGGVIEASPVQGIGRQKALLRRKLPRCLSEKEVLRIIEHAASPRDRALMELLFATGLRVSEVSGLEIAELDLDGGTLMVRGGKGNKDGLGIIGSYAVDALRGYLGTRRSGPVFLNRRGSRLRRHSIQRIVARTARRAGLHGVHPHTFRHTYATVLVNRGVDIRHVQELMRHERISTTAIYLQTAINDLSRAHERFHPHSRGGKDGSQG